MSDYNGWTNYETWNYQMHLANEEGAYLYWQEQAQIDRPKIWLVIRVSVLAGTGR